MNSTTSKDAIFNKVTAQLVKGEITAYEYADIIRQLDGEYCSHQFDREYIPNGNEGGFSSSLTYCTNCGKRLTENDF